MMRRIRPEVSVRSLVAGFAILLWSPGAAAAQEAEPPVFSIDTVRVEVSRLSTGGIPLARIPYSVQVKELDALPAIGSQGLADELRDLVGISSASQFGSPLQPDLRIRGFQAGPVVGFPQSISVFVDGVRVNEPDASQVNFDLIPMHAVERIDVIRSPGGPFGRNTLAGAINVITRRARDRGIRGAASLEVGSYETTRLQGWRAGDLGGGFDYLLSGRYQRSNGWRNLSSNRLRQIFAKGGYRRGGTDFALSYTFADNFIEAPGSLPQSWLQGNLPPELSGTRDPRRLQFTGFEGDWFDPLLHFVVFNGRQELGGGRELQLNSFLRSNAFTQFNDNITEPNARGVTGIFSGGTAAQVVGTGWDGMSWTAGAEVVRNDIEILIFSEANRAFPDAGEMTESVTSVEDNLGAFGHVWWPFSSRASLSASLRYDHVFLPVTDRLDPGNSGENTFDQVTGSFGAEFGLTPALRIFGSYGRGFRAPVILEVSCADPEDPCPLPFELGADPPLDPVTTDTWQAGARMTNWKGVRLEIAGYWSEVYDDLFAVVLPPSTRGYFKNLERTRRQGVEISGLVQALPNLTLSSSIALTRATFQSEALLASALLGDDDDDAEDVGLTPHEPEEGGGPVEVEPGNHFAMVPNLTAHLAGEYLPGDWKLTLEAEYVGSQFFVGDENNQERFGKLDAYLLVGGSVEREIRGTTLFGRAQNLLNSAHHTFGIIAPNLRGPDKDPQPFLSPGLPRRVEAGVRYVF